MKKITLLSAVLLTSQFIFSQTPELYVESDFLGLTNSKSSEEAIPGFKSVQDIAENNVDVVWADSVITFQFTSPNDSTRVIREYNTVYDNSTMDASYWTWSSYKNVWDRSETRQEYYPDGKLKLMVQSIWNHDSSKIIPGYKYEYNYDHKYQNLQLYNYDLSIDSFVGSNRTENYYNDFDEDSIIIEYKYNTTTRTWDNFKKTTHSYDTLGNHTNESRHAWDYSHWKKNTNYDYHYDSLNNLISLEMSGLIWDVLTVQSKNHYEYDSLNNMTFSFSEVFSSNEWINSHRTYKEYDEENRQTSDIYQSWDRNLNVWANNTKTEWKYSQSSTKKGALYPNGTSTEVEIIYSNWSIGSNDWHYTSKGGFAYDSYNRYAKQWGASWDNVGQRWINLWQIEIEYHEDLRLSESSYSKNNETDDWILERRKYYYYDGINVFANKILEQENQCNVFPNPAQNHITISQKQHKKARIEIFNLSGQLQMIKQFSNLTHFVNISKLEQGQYILKITSGNEEEIHKILKIE